jgi:hypothetical protein
VAEPPTCILGCHGEQRLANGFLKRFTCSGSRSSQVALELGEGLFDGGEVGRIAWQEQELATFGLDSLTHPLPFMGAQVVHHDKLSRVQTRGEELFHVDFKSNSIGRPLQDHGSSHALKRERGDQRCILAAIARHPACGALSFGGSRIKGRECDIRAALIHKDQLLCWQWAYFRSPGGSLLLVALRGTQRFFLRVQPTRRMARLIVV